MSYKTILVKLSELLSRLRFLSKGGEVKCTQEDVGFLQNLFDTKFEKNALVCFITNPFINRNHFFYHTNRQECTIICETLSSLNFNVDLIDYDKLNIKLKNEYSIVVGFGHAIEELLLKSTTKNFKLVLYRNGSDVAYHERQTVARAEQFYSKHNKLLFDSVLTFPFSLGIQKVFSDEIIVLGNQFVADTYRTATKAKVTSINLFYNDIGELDLSLKNFVEARNNFLWFGSKGAIHKGLDLVLDYFILHPELNLYVCGLNELELGFVDHYFGNRSYGNIHLMGFLRMDSMEFKETMLRCAAVIFPSCAEGGAGSILNVVAYAGLIPLVTDNVGLDLFGYDIRIDSQFTDDSIKGAINEYSKLSTEEIELRAVQLRKIIRKRHSVNQYRENIKGVLEKYTYEMDR